MLKEEIIHGQLLIMGDEDCLPELVFQLPDIARPSVLRHARAGQGREALRGGGDFP